MTMMWIVENTEQYPLLAGYDFALIELHSHNHQGELRKFIIDGSGVLWFPSVEGAAGIEKPMGKLWAVLHSDCPADLRQRAVEFCNFGPGKKALVFGATP